MKLLAIASLGAYIAVSADHETTDYDTSDCSSLPKKVCRQMGKDGGACMFARFIKAGLRKECVSNDCSIGINKRTCKKVALWGGGLKKCNWSTEHRRCCEGECSAVDPEVCVDEGVDGDVSYVYKAGYVNQVTAENKCLAIGCRLPEARTDSERAKIAETCEANRCWAAAMRGKGKKIRNNYGEGCELTTGWIDGEPNNYGGREKCVEVDSKSKLMNDNNCRNKNSSATVCECGCVEDMSEKYDYTNFGFTDKSSHWAAVKRCEDRGCKLANARNAEERSMIQAACGSERCWTALTRGEDHKIRSSFGKGCTVAEGWTEGEPNDYAGREDCVELDTKTGLMNDNRCDNWDTASTVCECPSE